MDTLYRLLEWNPVQVGSTFQGGGPPLHMKFSRDAAVPRIPAPHLPKQGQLQLAGASFREELAALGDALFHTQRKPLQLRSDSVRCTNW